MDEKRRKRRRRWLVGLAVVIGVVLLLSILGATVFKARRPITTVNSVTLREMDFSFDALHVKVHLNVSLDASISVKNPNKVGLKYTDSSALLDYRGELVGQAPIPAGQISAGQTLPINITLTIMADRFLSNSQALISDAVAGNLPLSTRARISGKETGNGDIATAPPPSHPKQRRRRCHIAPLATLLLLLAIILVGFIIGVTVFKVRDARTQVVSASLEGVAPRISFPAIKVELNITLNLTLLIQNRNHASFKSGEGEGVLLYQGNRVGDTHLHPGQIPARGTSTLICLLTVEVDRFADSGLSSLISAIFAGQLVLETKTRIPGRVTFLGIFHKHIVSTSDCQIVIGIQGFDIKSQNCKNHNKL